MGAFQIPIKLGTANAHALINTSAQCSVLFSGLVKRPFDKQPLQLSICGKIKVADGAIVNAHSPVVVTMESAFGEHMIKCIIHDDDNNDQCIILNDFLAHPDQASVSIMPHCQQWVTGTVFPTMTITIPNVIVQPLTTNNIAAEFPMEINITNSQCPLLFVNNMSNSIKLRPNKLITVANHALRYTKMSMDCQVATATAYHDLTDHKPATLDKLLPCHTNQQKLDFALNKMTTKTYVTTAQKTTALHMQCQNRNVFSLPGDKPTFTKELTMSIDTGTAKPLSDVPPLGIWSKGYRLHGSQAARMAQRRKTPQFMTPTVRHQSSRLRLQSPIRQG
uniref:Uncharacterized protein n=1 Tax=Romanomermis culicivorax TaxID=13658 RepID=A0A915KVJ4_ROMCU